MGEHIYTFEDVSNSYFMGSDVHVTRDDGKSLVINGKDGMCAVKVKRYSFDLPDEVKDIAEELNAGNRSRMAGDTFGREDWTDILFERCQEQWWEDARFLAEQHDFKGVYSAGRSGGWCCIDGTNTDWWPEAIMHPEPLPQPSEDEQFLAEEQHAARKRFLELAFELVESIDFQLSEWAERIREDHAELEREREECLVRGTD